jgi:hypothetical protein
MSTLTLDLHEVRRQHGGTVYDGGRRWSGPGPGHSKHDRSLSLVVTDSGRALVHSFAGDSFRDCAAYLGLPDARPPNAAELASERARRNADATKADAEARAFCSRIWEASRPIEGTSAETYLFRRGLIYEGAALRFHAAAPRSRKSDAATQPAMVAAVWSADGMAHGLHCTFLTSDGCKAFGDRSRLMFGRTGAGAARLEDLQSDVLAVAEGIETALGFASVKGVPTWAALSTSGLRAFVPPPFVRKLLIASDSDDGGAGLEAARALAQRASRICDVAIHPAPEGQDWADVAQAVAHA